ncbi:MAG: glycosyltransferase [Thermoguttaceae bacterium]
MTTVHGINVVLCLAGGLLLLPIAAFSMECLAALLPFRGKRAAAPTRPGDADDQDDPRPRTAVLIPAHDEQAVIGPTLHAIRPTLAEGDRLLVVADNCTDETAALARALGAEVIERTDGLRRGKGYALQCGIAALAADPPDALVIVDADCLVEPRTVEVLARWAVVSRRPVQARNLTDRRPADGPVEAVSILANRFTNLVRPRGLGRLGAPCRLTGTGMAFPWALAVAVQPAGGSLVEDLQLGIDLAMRGHRAEYCAEVGVTSELPEAGRAFASQRTRWEQGHLRMMGQVPRLLLTGLRRRSWPLVAMAADLSIPPLTLLVGLWLVFATLSGLACWLGGSVAPAILAATGGAALAGSLGLGWIAFCRRQVPARTLVAVPWYMVRKAPIYVRMIARRQKTWIRTERTPGSIYQQGLRVDYTSQDEATSHERTEARGGTARGDAVLGARGPH